MFSGDHRRGKELNHPGKKEDTEGVGSLPRKVGDGIPCGLGSAAAEMYLER